MPVVRALLPRRFGRSMKKLKKYGVAVVPAAVSPSAPHPLPDVRPWGGGRDSPARCGCSLKRGCCMHLTLVPRMLRCVRL